VEQENVCDVYELAKRMLPSQLLIFASTSDIAEGSGSKLVDENSLFQSHLLDSYTASMLRHENALRNLSFTSNIAPQIVSLRFGSVIDLSESQPIDFSHMTLVCQVFRSGRIRVIHPESERTFLCMEDLVRAITILIKHSNKSKEYDLFHLQSFSATISNIANVIASRTGAYIDASDHPRKEDSYGFALNTTKFRTTFEFVFGGDQIK
jgi:nucleoside-diphosphate-sugar epimerase